MKANKEQTTRLLKTAKGQIEGIIKMVEEDRYCIDISNQILAAESILKKVNKEMIRAHLSHCVKDSFEKENSEEKINEVLTIIEKMTK